jgi:phosphoglycerate dehydrogenase-like enzyme
VKPRVYIHRAGPWYGLFMTADNEADLASFAEVVSEGARETPVERTELVRRLEGCAAILSLNGYGASDITPDILKTVGSVRLICKAHHWGQFENVPPHSRVTVIDGSNAGTVAVAEWCLTAALMGTRQIQVFDRRLKAGSPWGEPRRNVGLLAGCVVGLVGLGRIGLYVARCFRALGVDVIACSASATADTADALGIRLVGLDELLTTADVISLHWEVVDATRNRLGPREFSLIKSGAILINSARAALYDEAALIRELRTGRFSAYIDVFAVEPLPLDHPFRTMDNVTVTPHIAGNNAAMFHACGREALRSLRRYFDGHGAIDERDVFP